MLLLPISTIVIISVVSGVLLIVVIIAILRAKHCCIWSKDKRGAKHEELDRFLQTEESEDEYLSSSNKGSLSKEVLETFNEAYEQDGQFHYVEEDVKLEPVITSEVSAEVDLEQGDINPDDETIVSCTVDVPGESAINTENETTVPVDDISISAGDNASITSIVVESPLSETQTVELAHEPPSLELQAEAAAPDLLPLPSGGVRDDLSIHSDDTNNISTGSTIPKSRRLNLQSKLSRSTQRIYSSFSDNAKIKVNLQYIESVKCLKGCIVGISGLDFQAEHCPHEINFHLRFFPNKKFHIATRNKAIWEDTDLNLTFTMGPVFVKDLTDNKLRVKLYGKKTQRLTRSKCYGECSLHLEDIVGKSEPIEFEEILVQRTGGSSRSSSDSDGVI